MIDRAFGRTEKVLPSACPPDNLHSLATGYEAGGTGSGAVIEMIDLKTCLMSLLQARGGGSGWYRGSTAAGRHRYA